MERKRRRTKVKEKKRVVNPNKAKAGEPRAPKQKTRMSCLGFELWGDGGGTRVQIANNKNPFWSNNHVPFRNMITPLHSTYIIVLWKEFLIGMWVKE